MAAPFVWRGLAMGKRESTINRIVARSICLCALAACGGDGAPSAPPAPAPPPPTAEPPAVPGGLQISATGEDFIEWRWNAVEGATGYDVQFSPNEAFTNEDGIIARRAEELTYLREGLAAGMSAYLRVRSASGTGSERLTSEWTSHVAGMTAESPPPPTAEPDRAALVALYEATDGPNWVNSENWLTDAPLRDWYGVWTDGAGRVVSLNLNGNDDRGVLELVPHGLTGPIPPELGNLTKLTSLSLRFNNLTSAIPSELGNLTSLEDLFLDYNDLTGAIPPELGNLTRLFSLYLAANELSGPIPVEFVRLQRLTNVFLPGGVCIPDELRAWATRLSISASPCNTGKRLLPSALIREDGNGLSLALPDDLREPSALTVSDSGVVAASVADGWLELAPQGRGTAEVEVVPSGGGDPAYARVVVRAAVGSFGIDIVMDRPAPATYEEALIVAADWWSGLLDGTEWPDREPACFNDRATAVADELLIHAWIDRDISHPGYADPCFRRSGQQVTLDPGGGGVGVNPSNANPSLVQHEMGHLLGLVLWRSETGLVTADGAYFVGPRAVEAFRASGGDGGLRGVPISGSHWGSGVRDFMASDSSQVVISAAALADAGYTVDMSKARPIRP